MLIDDFNAYVLIIPHVLGSKDVPDSDLNCNETLLSEFSGKYADRLMVLPTENDPRTAKWCIAQCDWFCGTRMHSTIASLSSGVPTASIVYSDKAKGVFASSGVESAALDPRKFDAEEMLHQLCELLNSREKQAEVLKTSREQLREKVSEQVRITMDAFAERA